MQTAEIIFPPLWSRRFPHPKFIITYNDQKATDKCAFLHKLMEVYSCTHGQRRDSISRLWSSVTVEAGVNFLSAGYRIATGNVTFCKERQSSFSSRSHRISTISGRVLFPSISFSTAYFRSPPRAWVCSLSISCSIYRRSTSCLPMEKPSRPCTFTFQALWFILGLEIAVIVLFGGFWTVPPWT